MAKKSKLGAVISDDLIATLIAHPEITEVHINTQGKHVLHAYPHGKELYGMITSEDIMKDSKKINVKAPILSSRIVETLTRKDILGTEDK
jgi:D-hexose-6-phosphate mutarotase